MKMNVCHLPYKFKLGAGWDEADSLIWIKFFKADALVKSTIVQLHTITSTSVTIFFLYYVFFFVSIVHHPYFHFAPLYEETDLYLLAFPHSSSPLFLSL